MKKLLICILLACNVQAEESENDLTGMYQCTEKAKVGIDKNLRSGGIEGSEYESLSFTLLVKDGKIELTGKRDHFVPMSFSEKDSIIIKPGDSTFGDFILASSEKTGRMFRMSDNEFKLIHSYGQVRHEGFTNYELLSIGTCIKL